MIGVSAILNRLPRNLEGMWIDVGFWVAPDGRVAIAIGDVNNDGYEDVLTGTSTRADRTATTATVTVSGFSLSVIPGWKVRITQSASVPVGTGTAWAAPWKVANWRANSRVLPPVSSPQSPLRRTCRRS